MKKRLVAFLVLFALICTAALSLASCGEKYPPQESTSEEKRTVMTLTYEDESYDVSYELYRSFFLQLKSTVDGGDSTVWTGAEKDKYISEIDSLILDRICEIYSVFHLSKKVGINPYSRDMDKLIKEYIEVAVEGGTIGGSEYKGYDGNYEAYLADLKAMNLNYSVHELLIRYSIALTELTEYYVGAPDENEFKNGAIEYTKDAVRAFYLDENESRRMLRVFLSADAFTESRAQQIRDGIISKPNEDSVKNYIIQFSTSGATDIKNGEVIGKYTLDKFYYSEITESLFNMGIGETSEVIELNSDELEGFTIVYRTSTSDEHFEACYSDILLSYLQNEAGKLINNAAADMSKNAEYSDYLKNLDRSTVSIN